MTISDLIAELQKLPPKMKAVSRQGRGPKQVIYPWCESSEKEGHATDCRFVAAMGKEPT